ncbi:hypothetical protein GSI_09480 [Ganoderma sinense ZZ0214-1]|uniref:Uncharacterized protein n=1 Tax=Ganoderma sinense ZZ0214-1 TaxID=1077348 RepID=A0A2G8S3H8_9APHY|nr:hypothetical protein GSI_09480 [Ganoderma sinense ZZ0214-1]
MTFERYDKDEERYKPLDDSDSGTLKFGDDGLLVWPTDKNKEIDATYQDTPCDLKNPQVPYYVPNSGWMRVIYKFASGLGKVVEVTGPINHFFGQPNPVTYKHTKDKEGLIFVGDPDILRGDVDAIFGLNFFQSMFVALHKPSASEAPPFVTLAPQWDSQVVQFSPRRKEGSGV